VLVGSQCRQNMAQHFAFLPYHPGSAGAYHQFPQERAPSQMHPAVWAARMKNTRNPNSSEVRVCSGRDYGLNLYCCRSLNAPNAPIQGIPWEEKRQKLGKTLRHGVRHPGKLHHDRHANHENHAGCGWYHLAQRYFSRCALQRRPEPNQLFCTAKMRLMRHTGEPSQHGEIPGLGGFGAATVV